MFELDNVKNEAILRDSIFQIWQHIAVAGAVSINQRQPISL